MKISMSQFKPSSRPLWTVASLFFVISIVSGCAGYLAQTKAAEQDQRSANEQRARTLIAGFVAQCAAMGYIPGSSSNSTCVSNLAGELLQREQADQQAQKRQNLCALNETNAWLAPTPTGNFFESVQRVNEARLACDRDQVWTAPPPAPTSSPQKNLTCSLVARRLISQNQVACKWACGNNEFETIERATFGCQSSPIK